MSVTVNGVKVDTIVAEAKSAARIAAEQFFQEKLNGRDQFACGFAWVDIFGVKGNTKLGRALKEAGVRKSHTGAFQIWNPSNMYVQNVDTLEAGAQAAADVFKKYGFSAYAGSRLD
jgi:hypothetical protein